MELQKPKLEEEAKVESCWSAEWKNPTKLSAGQVIVWGFTPAKLIVRAAKSWLRLNKS